MRLINVDRRKLARGDQSQNTGSRTRVTLRESLSRLRGNCRSQLIRYSKECFIKPFINAVLFLLTPLTFATGNCLENTPEKAARIERERRAVEKLRNSKGAGLIVVNYCNIVYAKLQAYHR